MQKNMSGGLGSKTEKPGKCDKEDWKEEAKPSIGRKRQDIPEQYQSPQKHDHQSHHGG
jgi:hypothetical protein